MKRLDGNIKEDIGKSEKLGYSANMVVEKTAKYYRMDHPNRGYAYIFSHEKFKDENHETRLGADVDSEEIINCLNKLGFKDIIYFKDLRLAEIKYRIHEVVNLDHTNNDCFMLFVLTHGSNGGKLQAFDEDYDPEEVLWNQFTADKCPTLAGKPKLFFVHAPQGPNVDPGMQLVHKPHGIETDGIAEYKIPIKADFLIMYSTARGYHAFHDEKGSHFILVLTEELEKGMNGKDFLTILTLVNQRVAVEFTSNHNDTEKHNKKQAPYFHSYLMRIWNFSVKSPEKKEVAGNMNVLNNTFFNSIHGDVPDGSCIGKPRNDIPDGRNGAGELQNYRAMLPESSAWASVNKDDLYYKMDHGNKGIAYIFNHEKFNRNMCDPRRGSQEDRKKMEKCFRNLGFDVHPFQDLKMSEIREQIRQGKPKLFFIQACQGGNLDPGVPMVENKMSRTETDGSRLPYTIPIHSDFLIMYATAKGYFAFRNTDKGSYFIMVLCEELEKLAYKDHLLNILTMVNQRVAIEFASSTKDPTRNRQKQIPYFHSSLTRLMHFVETTKL